eukprot:CAMPEP_0113604802 /NCGR_PEP_ID=MMETSP0017_2-20120614/1988_1 /TAXON_ID=2856 /ORGANISM="Cylindrotheca closterium" /LENGTH=429 /DNA_ID=CAMNT_0000513249 /DNA_START=77 /DNA_END=1366 /DNA_ORIENTATION=- /assembly_acc=CAM_ASM_000147
MGILDHFLSTLNSVNNGRPSHQIRPWENTMWLPPAERNLRSLEDSSIVQRSFFLGALQCALQRELWILARWIYIECSKKGRSSRRIISLCAPWKWSLSKWKESILPFMARHEATLSTMYFYKFLASTFCSEVVLLQLSQHPYHRVKSLRLRDSSLLSVAANAFVITAWSNLLYYLADLTVRQVSLGLHQRKEYQWAEVRKDTEAKEHCLQHWVKSSWEMLYQQSLRYWYSSLGSAMGSMVLPGWGTLAGIGLGEQWADHQDVPSPPPLLLKVFPRLQKCFVKTRSKRQQGSLASSLQSNAVLCGCCQTNYFSSNPNHPTHVPISSKGCEHSICRSCVDLCQVAELLEAGATGIAFSEQLVACPICNAAGAFSPRNLLVNRGLCNAIALLERSGGSSEPSSIVIDVRSVKRYGRLSRAASSMSDDATLSV